MNHRILTLLTGGLLMLVAATVLALPPAAHRPHALASPATVDNTSYIDANRILMFVTNHGNFGRDLSDVFGNDYGTYYPFSGTDLIIDGSNIKSPFYAGGLWIGGVDATTGDTLVCLSEYASEYVPGPMAGGTFQTDRPEFRVYKLYRDSMAGNPNQDYLDWPIDQGAPVDLYGQPALQGDQMCWSVYNDADPTAHNGRVDAGETDPIGLEVQQTTYAYLRNDEHGDVVYITWKIYNKGGKTLNDCYISLWTDPDVGAPGDDLVGCDTLSSVMFAYNEGDIDSRYTPLPPPACGFKMLAGPVVPSAGDTAVFCGSQLPGYRNLGIASFNKYINGTDPDNYQETYWYMLGLDAKNSGAPYVYNGDTLRFVHSGDPVTGTGDLDFSSTDRRMMASYGPFDFLPGDSQQIMTAFSVGLGSDRLNSITVLRRILNDVAPSPVLPCCLNRRGNVDYDPSDLVTMADLTVMIDHLFITLAPLPCPEEAQLDDDAANQITMGDLTLLIDNLFISLDPLPLCP